MHSETLHRFVRMARRSPGKLLFLMASLGLSFGLAAAVGTLTHATWFRLPAGVAGGDYVSLIRQAPDGYQWMSLDDAERVRELVPEMRWFHVRAGVDLNVSAPSGVRQVRVDEVSGNFFAALGIEPALGSLSGGRDGPAAVLGEALRRELSAAGQDAVGGVLRIEGGMAVPIIGVAPPAFRGISGAVPDAWILDATHSYNPADGIRDAFFVKHGGTEENAREIFRKRPQHRIFGRVPQAGSVDSVEIARSALSDYAFDASGVFMQGGGVGFGVEETDRLAVYGGLETRPDMRSDTRSRMVWLLCIVALLLAVAFLSLVDFLMAENLARDEEQAVRVALGASQWDVFRRTLAENALWIAAVAALGGLSSGYAIDVLLGVEPFSEYIGAASAASQLIGLGAGAVLLAVAFLSGVAYASHFASRSARSLVAARERRPQWLARAARGALLFSALASLLAVFSLVARYWDDARGALLIAHADALLVGVRSAAGRGEKLWVSEDSDAPPVSPLVDAIAAIPDVESVGAASLLPLGGGVGRLWVRAGVLRNEPALADTAFYNIATTWELFPTLGVELLAGRLPAAGDEAVLSRAAAVALAGSAEAALGRLVDHQLYMLGNGQPSSPKAVVGVVDDMPYGDYAEAQTRIVYTELEYFGGWSEFAITHRGSADAIVRAMREMPAFATLSVESLGTPAARLRGQFLAHRSVEILLSAAGAFVFVLALAGVANSLARSVAAQRRSIGIRLALGAPGGAVLRGHVAPVLGDLLPAAALVAIVALSAKLFGGSLAALVDICLLAPAALCLAAVCVVVCHALIRQLTLRRSLGALVQEN